MYRLLRPLLFRLDAEDAHGWGMRMAGLGQRAPAVVRALFPRADARLAQTVWGMDFASPVGLAAGFDKNAARIPFWSHLGLGFAEVGSVTALGGAGNPRPRAFRLPDDRALVNRLGLGNDGAEAVARTLAGPRPPGFVVGVNVAKTHSPDILGADGIEDVRRSVAALASHADYLALNVSCPNTAEGKTFETPDALDALLAAVTPELDILDRRPPLLVKWSPPASGGVDTGAFDELVGIALEHGVDGFVATNTASDRADLATEAGRLAEIGRGGLSGRPLRARATALTRHLFRTTEGRVPIIGVGGVDSAEAAYERVRAGASLVELYTGLVYEGPGLIGRIHRGLVRLLDRDGLDRLADAVGQDA